MTRRVFTLLPLGPLQEGSRLYTGPFSEHRMNRFAERYNEFCTKLREGQLDLKLWKSTIEPRFDQISDRECKS